MKRFSCITLSVLCLWLWLVPAGAQEVSREQKLRAALLQVESRGIQEELFQLDPATGQLGAVFYAAAAGGYLSHPDYAYWYVAEGQAPQKLLEGLDQSIPSDEEPDDFRTYNREPSTSFAHEGHGYFILHLRTGGRQSEFSELYMMQPGGLKKMETFSGAGYHPDVGFYQVGYEYATEEAIEASRAQVIDFVSLKGEQLRYQAGLKIQLHDLHQLQNGNELIATLTDGGPKLVSLYYLPNNLVVVNFREYVAASRVTALYICLIGIEGGRGRLLIHQWNLEHADSSQPFWQPASSLEDALQDGWYEAYDVKGSAIVPTDFLRPSPALTNVYGQTAAGSSLPGGAADTLSLLKQQLDQASSGNASDKQLKEQAAIIDGADEDIRSLFFKVWGHYAIGRLDVPGAGSYNPNGKDLDGDGRIGPGDFPVNSINLHLGEDETNERGPYATFFHEVGHAVDGNLGSRDDQPSVITALMTQQFTADTEDYDRVTLEEAARFDVAQNLRKFAGIYAADEQQADRVHMLIWSKYTEDVPATNADREVALKLRAHYNLMFQDDGHVLSDIYGAATNNRIHLNQDEISKLNKNADTIRLEIQYETPYHHSAKDGYWYTVEQIGRGYKYSRTYAMGPELFAGYFSARMRGAEKELRLIKNFLPNATKLLEDNIRIMLMKANDRGW